MSFLLSVAHSLAFVSFSWGVFPNLDGLFLSLQQLSGQTCLSFLQASLSEKKFWCVSLDCFAERPGGGSLSLFSGIRFFAFVFL